MPAKSKKLAKMSVTLRDKNGEPTEEITAYELIKRLFRMACTQKEVAAVLGVSADTIQRDPVAMDMMDDGLNYAKASLRRVQFEAAQKGNVTMQIWLGKQLLGQRDNMMFAGDPTKPLFSPNSLIINMVRRKEGGELVKEKIYQGTSDKKKPSRAKK